MIKFLVICILSIFLVGCGFTRTQYRDVPVPVYQVPAPPSIDRPHLPIYDLTATDSNDTEKVIKAYLTSVRLLLNYSEALSEIVNTYRNLAEETDSSFVEPVFSMAFSIEREDIFEVSELERLRMIAQARQIKENADTRFNSILQDYTENNEKIWKEWEEDETSDD